MKSLNFSFFFCTVEPLMAVIAFKAHHPQSGNLRVDKAANCKYSDHKKSCRRDRDPSLSSVASILEDKIYQVGYPEELVMPRSEMRSSKLLLYFQ